MPDEPTGAVDLKGSKKQVNHKGYSIAQGFGSCTVRGWMIYGNVLVESLKVSTRSHIGNIMSLSSI